MGFTIDLVFGDNECGKIKGKVNATVQTCSANEHVPGIEIEILVIKERQK